MQQPTKTGQRQGRLTAILVNSHHYHTICRNRKQHPPHQQQNSQHSARTKSNSTTTANRHHSKKTLCVFDPYDIKLTRTYWLLKGISKPVKQPNQQEDTDNNCPRAVTAPAGIPQDYPTWIDDVDEQYETSERDALVKEGIKEAHRLLGFAKKVGLKTDSTTTEPCLNYRSLKKTVGVSLL